MTNQPEPIRKSSLPTTPPPEWEFFTFFPYPDDDGGDMVRGQRQRGVQVRRLVTYGDWEPVRPDRWADEPEPAAVSAAVAPPTQTALDAARATNQRLNREKQRLESELATYRRAVAQWEISEHSTYVPLRSLAAIAKAAGVDVPDRWEAHYERVERAEAELRRMADETATETPAVDLPTLAAALDGLHTLIATSSRDWQTYRVDAWLWAVLCGWDCEQTEHDETCVHGALEETAAMHGWDEATIAKARRYRAAVRAVTEQQPADETATETPAPDDRNAGPGWYEVITSPQATTCIAYVHEDGSLYLPEGDLTEEEFAFAAARGKAHRLVRADEQPAAGARQDQTATETPAAEPTAEDIARAHVTSLHLIGEQLATIESWFWEHLADVRDAGARQDGDQS